MIVDKKIFKCDSCGKHSKRIICLLRRVKYHFCNKECLRIWKKENLKGENNPNWRGRIIKECQICTKTFFVIISRKNKAKTCSIRCRHILQSKLLIGDKSPNWQGGITNAYRLHHNTRAWDKRRKECYSRDHGVCQYCQKSSKEVRITAHHIKPWRTTKDDSLNNLITLCLKCHQKEEHRIRKDMKIGRG
jgi:hypothetical protein